MPTPHKNPTTPRHNLRTLRTPIGDLRPHPRNARNGDVDAVAESLTVNGQFRPIVVARGGVILAGNHTYAAAMQLGWTHIMTVTLDLDPESPEALRIMLADNRTADLGGYDESLLLELLADLDSLAGSGYDEGAVDDLRAIIDAIEHAPLGPPPSLADRFLVPPFSVLDARQGWWQDRKRQWVALGIKSELGREEAPQREVEGPARNTSLGARPADLDGPANVDKYRGAKKQPGRNRDLEKKRTLGQGLSAHRAADGTLVYEEIQAAAAVSIFDPVLCEVAYRWFCPPGGTVLDPYAGGSVRGIVAALLGLTYHGIELREEQADANREQAERIIPGPPAPGAAAWTVGDSSDVLPTLPPESVDLIFTCPPYYDLEVYSDDPRDLSRMKPADFDRVYTEHLSAAAAALRPDRFAVIVTGNVRDKHGHLMDLAAVTTRAMESAGCHLYNDAILVTQLASLPVRAARSFMATRVLGRTHQEVLVFVKGSRVGATAACGLVDTSDALADVDVPLED